MATNAATLISFGGELSVGDWIYSVIPRSAPAYLPLTNNSISYLQSSYPALTAVLGSNNKFTYTIVQPQTVIVTTPANAWRAGLQAFGNNMFVTTPYAEYYSSSGATYYLLYSTATPGWSSYQPSFLINMTPFNIAYGNNVFAAVGAATGSPPGVTGLNTMYYATKATILASGAWTSKTLPDTLVWTGIAYDSNTNVWVAVTGGTNANTARSTDGLTTWTRGGVVTGSTAAKPIAAGNSTFTILPYNTANGRYSTDGGVTWANSTGYTSDAWQAIAYGNGVFVAVASNATNTTAASSTNGITFTSLAVPDLGYAGARQLNNVEYGNGTWCITSSIGSNSTSAYLTHAFSTDLITWTTTSITGNTTTNAGVNLAGYAGANNEWFNMSRNGYGTRFVATANTTAFTLPLVTSQWGAIPYIKAT